MCKREDYCKEVALAVLIVVASVGLLIFGHGLMLLNQDSQRECAPVKASVAGSRG